MEFEKKITLGFVQCEHLKNLKQMIPEKLVVRYGILRKSYLLVLVLALVPWMALTAEPEGGLTAYQMTEDQAGYISLNSYIKVYPIRAEIIEIEEALQIHDSLFFHISQQEQLGENRGAWVKFKISNETETRRFAHIGICRDLALVEVYRISNGVPSKITTIGSDIHPSERAIPTPTSVFEVPLAAGETSLFYARAKLMPKMSNIHYYHFTLGDDFFEYFTNHLNRNLLWAIFAGVMILFSVFSFVMFFSFKERIFILYSLFMFSLTWYFVSQHQLISYYIKLPAEYLHNYIPGISILFITLFSYYYLEHYLKLKERMPKFNLYFKVYAYLAGSLGILHFFIFENRSIGFDLSNYAIVFYLLLTLYPILRLYFKGVKEAKVMLYSAILLIIGGLTYTLTLLRVIPHNTLSINSFQIGAMAFSGLLFYGLFDKINAIQKEKLKFRIEKEKTDDLLFNILPAEVAKELKENGHFEARDFSAVSVLFTDFKDFTATSTKLSAVELVKEVNHCFVAFDQIMEKHRVEKIKTIGDSYMAAGGLETHSPSQAKEVVLAGIEMQEFLQKRRSEIGPSNRHAFEMRVGIHTGPVVAGIVGVKKFQYDIWGDTVNTASRIESGGEVGKVNISEATYQFIKDDPDFCFEERPAFEVKGKGMIKMWFVSKSKSRLERELAQNSETVAS